MTERDTLHRFIIERTNVRGEWVHLDATWQAVLERADYPDAVRETLGEAMAAVALLEENPRPSREETRQAMSGNLCRCGAYDHYLNGVMRASGQNS